MKLNRRHFLGASIVAGAALAAPMSLASSSIERAVKPLPAEPKLADPPDLVQQALAALERHSSRISLRDRVGIADFSLNSGEPRFHLVDVEGGLIEKSYLVSHGRGSDPANSGYVQRFSNRPGSNASSRGSYLTGDTYYGKHGRSRRLHGLEPENDHAFQRAIVIHGAGYVDQRMASLQGRVGRSLGCFAFERSEIDEVLELLGPGRLLFAGN